MATVEHASDSIAVRQFRQVIWLPLKCHGDFDACVGSGAWRDHWKRTRVPLLDLIGQDGLAQAAAGARSREDDAYASYVYFHPYIRRFLFEGDEADRAAPRTWELTQSERFALLDVVLPAGQPSSLEQVFALRFELRRCLLHHFPLARVVLLEVELMARERTGYRAAGPAEALPADVLSLAEAMDALDFLRRTHPGFFPAANEKVDGLSLHDIGGRYPLSSQFRPIADAGPLTAAVPTTEALQSRKADLLGTVHSRNGDGYATPLGAPWAELLGPAATVSRQIEDERMPYAAYIAVDDPHAISRPDWIRLANADYRGSSSALPYSQAFVADFEAAHCYDRFFDPSQSHWANTRYLNTGFAFTMVGAAGSTFFNDTGLQSFRFQYCLMGLLAHFNKAALLSFSNRLTECSEQRNPDNPSGYREALREILLDLTEFTHRHWFEGVSNQLQAAELYRFWSRHLGLPELYAGVTTEARSAYEFIVVEEAREQTRQERHQADRLETLGRAAFWLSLAGIALALLGAGFPFDKPLALDELAKVTTECWGTVEQCPKTWTRIAVLMATAGGLATLVRKLWTSLTRSNSQP